MRSFYAFRAKNTGKVSRVNTERKAAMHRTIALPKPQAMKTKTHELTPATDSGEWLTSTSAPVREPRSFS